MILLAPLALFDLFCLRAFGSAPGTLEVFPRYGSAAVTYRPAQVCLLAFCPLRSGTLEVFPR